MEEPATLAQLVERLIRNQQVAGSTPAGGSSISQKSQDSDHPHEIIRTEALSRKRREKGSCRYWPEMKLRFRPGHREPSGPGKDSAVVTSEDGAVGGAVWARPAYVLDSLWPAPHRYTTFGPVALSCAADDNGSSLSCSRPHRRLVLDRALATAPSRVTAGSDGPQKVSDRRNMSVDGPRPGESFPHPHPASLPPPEVAWSRVSQREVWRASMPPRARHTL